VKAILGAFLVDIDLDNHSSSIKRIQVGRIENPRIVIASTQSTRSELANIMFPGLPSITSDGGEEPHTHDLAYVARRKTLHALKLLRKEATGHGHPVNSKNVNSESGLLLQAILCGKSFVLAADTNNALGLEPEEHLLKPEEEQSLEQILIEIGKKGYYLVRSGTAIVNGIARVGTAQVVVELNDTARKALHSPEGRELYMSKMAEMFGKQFFTKVSGGIAFEVLMALGWIQKINGVDIASAGSDEAVTLLAVIARSGFVAEVIAQLSPKAAYTLHNNPIIDGIVADARSQQAQRPQ
jgi:hypothetical protein